MKSFSALLTLLVACPPGKHDSARESPPVIETGESGVVDSVETGHGETGHGETGERETGGGDSGGDTDDTTLNGPGICGVDGVPSDGAPLGYVSLADAEARFLDYGGDAAAGDQDGDGCSDLLLGYVVFTGPALGEMEAFVDGGAYLRGQKGEIAVYPASGDINGDGLADWVIGGDGIDGGLGGAYVAYGPVYGEVDLWTEADAILLGQGDGAGGQENASVDVDSDGYDDILIGSLNYSTTPGLMSAIYLQRGPVEGTMALSDSEAVFYDISAPPTLSAGGDDDGDGLPEICIGGYGYQGFRGGVWVFSPPVSGMVALADADAVLIGEGYSYAGYDLSSGGDVNGDGYGDLLVGAPEYANMSGRAYLLHGPVSGEHALSEADAIVWAPGLSARVGKSVSLEQDMDGDGRADVAIGAPGADGAPNKGAVFLFYEPFSGTVDAFDEAEAVLYSEVDEPGPSTGYRMAPAGDINGDGYDDLHIGTLPDYLVFGGPR